MGYWSDEVLECWSDEDWHENCLLLLMGQIGDMEYLGNGVIVNEKE